MASALVSIAAATAILPAACEAVVRVLRPTTAADSLRYADTVLLEVSPADAAAMADSVLRGLESANPVDSLVMADALDVRVRACIAGGKGPDPATRTSAERALGLRERLQSKKDLAAAPTLLLLGEALAQARRYDDAEAMLKRSIASREAEWGKNDPLVAESLDRYARFLYEKAHAGGSNYVSAQPLINALGAVVLGVASEKLVKGSGLDAAAQWSSTFVEEPGVCKELREAENLAERALDIRTHAPIRDDAAIAASHRTLAELARDGGDLEEAREHLEIARELQAVERGGRSDPTLAIDLEIAEILLDEMAHAEARLLLERTLASLERAGNPDSSSAFRAHLGVARVYEALGDSTRVGAALGRADAFRPGLNTADWRQAVEAASLMARLRQRAGDLRGAEASFEEALRTAERSGGKDHPAVADVCMDLGRLHEARRDPKRAMKWFGRAADIREAAFGDRHPLVADCWLEKAICQEARGNEWGAKDSWDRAVLILNRSVGPTHPKAALARQRQALHYRVHFTGFQFTKHPTDPGLAFDFAIAGHQAWRRHVASTVRYLPETEALAVASRPSLGLDVSLDLLGAKFLWRSLSDVRKAWDELIRSRSLVLDEMAERHQRVGESDDPATRSLRAELRERRQHLAELLVSGAGSFSFGRYAERIEAERREVAEIEQELFARTAEHDTATERAAVGLDEVLAVLPPKSALLAYARYRHFEKKRSEERYLALYCVAGGKPEFVHLERAQRIDDAVARWRREAGPDAIRPGRSEAAAGAAYREAGDHLRSLIWDPVEKSLGNPDRIFIVPDGVLNLVNWAALPSGGGGYLIESGPLIHYLGTERDLAAASERRSGMNPPVLFGGPDYDRADAGGALDSLLASAAARAPYRGLRAACGDFDVVRFTPLPGTALEVRTIADVIGSARASGQSGAAGDSPRVFTGSLATEGVFKAESGRAGVLHVATHGFFLGGGCSPVTERARAIGAIEYQDQSPAVHPDGGHPLRLSGLAFAGANLRGNTLPGTDDGVLTAEEIAALDLRHVDWAVLSACDTGVGDVKAGEGVFGLRRAFQIAGARTLIMSLWPVDDQATRAWMERLYESRFERGLGTAESAREASLSVLRERRQQGASTHPFFWAGFVAVGDRP